MKLAGPIQPCLWFDGRGEEAAKFYVSIFENSKVGKVSRYTEAGKEIHQQEPGSAQSVEFTINGQNFLALNGGPMFKFSEAISFQIFCESQKEVDYFWDRLREGGGEEGPCGWLKDRFGLSWQVVPSALPKMLTDGTGAQAQRVTAAFMQMKKLDVAALEKAYAG